MVVLEEAELTVADRRKRNNQLVRRRCFSRPGVDAVHRFATCHQFSNDRDYLQRGFDIVAFFLVPADRLTKPQFHAVKVSERAAATRSRTDVPLVRMLQIGDGINSRQVSREPDELIVMRSKVSI